MCIVIVAFFVKAADPKPPASVLVPADSLHIAGFHGNDGGSYLAHHIMSEMLALEAIAAGNTKIVIILIGKMLSNGREGF